MFLIMLNIKLTKLIWVIKRQIILKNRKFLYFYVSFKNLIISQIEFD